MLSKALIFAIVVPTIFLLLFLNMDPRFLPIGFESGNTAKTIRETFDVADLTTYQQFGEDNMTKPYSSIDNGPAPPDWEYGLPSGYYLEVWWSIHVIPWGGPIWWEGTYYTALELRHTQITIWGRFYHNLEFYNRDGVKLKVPVFDESHWIDRSLMVQQWDSNLNMSIFIAKCDHITTNIIFQPSNQSKSIGQAWDEGKISYKLSYEVNWNNTGINAFTVLGQLFSFQGMVLGVPGVAGLILGGIIVTPIVVCVAYIFYKIVAGLIPFVSGGSGD